jgi:peptidoglycan hydrolase CwlO-like protein
MTPAQGDEEMFPSMRGLFAAVVLLTATGALADEPIPGADVPAREIVTRTPVETPKADEELQMLTREVQSLDNDVKQLQAKQTERALHEVEFLDQTNHPLWP